ncbi:hypothetical protein ACIOWF_16030 [Cellulosimicrobium cellulans]|uniref:hypothetical protein n=1 Tax=Cellulosimicrobium cellulans TaxID=1710 RepID=UPI0037F4AF61
MEIGILQERITSAHRYFRCLRDAMETGWDRLYSRHHDGQSSTSESLVLVHPVWLEQSGRTTPSRAARGFQRRVPNFEVCASPVLWGYDCPNGTGLEVDHLFPYALGGPTVFTNALYLCGDHNRAKGHDVHLIPWEQTDRFSWLADEIESVAALRRAL